MAKVQVDKAREEEAKRVAAEEARELVRARAKAEAVAKQAQQVKARAAEAEREVVVDEAKAKQAKMQAQMVSAEVAKEKAEAAEKEADALKEVEAEEAAEERKAETAEERAHEEHSKARAIAKRRRRAEEQERLAARKRAEAREAEAEAEAVEAAEEQKLADVRLEIAEENGDEEAAAEVEAAEEAGVRGPRKNMTWSQACPGTIGVAGLGQVALANSEWNVPHAKAGAVEVRGGTVVAHMTGRTYFAETCAVDGFNYARYSAVKLLGKTMRWTTNLSGVGCGCNAAFYLTSLRQNPELSGCHDYYCDANRVCDIDCAEIDLQEANQFAWWSTLHARDDGGGVGVGYGGARRDWTRDQYGPGSGCIDTKLPIQAAASFRVNGTGAFSAMEIVLSQAGRSCSLSRRIDRYSVWGRDRMPELSKALGAGMTPIISYWSSDSMLWLDGRGPDGQGPCDADLPAECKATTAFSGFSLENIQDPVQV